MARPKRSSKESILRKELARVESSLQAERLAGQEPDPGVVARRSELEQELSQAAADTEAPHAPQIVSTPLSEVQAEQVRWLWRGLIPLAKVTLLDGDPGLGKSTILADLAARITRGRQMSDGSPSDLAGPVDAVIISTEDGTADTILPRCTAAGADLERIHVVKSVATVDDDGSTFEQSWRLPDHVTALSELVGRLEAMLVVIDPASAVLSASVNANRDQDVRAALRPLSDLAEQKGCAIVLIRHFNKAEGSHTLYRGMGSIGWTAAVRSALLVAKDPADPTGNRRVFGGYKSNLASAGRFTCYEIVPDEQDRARVSWGGSSPYSSRELLQGSSHGDEPSDSEEIATYLAKWVETESSITCKDARKRLSDHGFAVSSNSGQKMVQRAAKRAGLKTTDPRTFGGDRSYYHPEHPPSLDIASSMDTGAPAVPTVLSSQNRRSGPSVDIPLPVSTLPNGRGPKGNDAISAAP